MLVEGLTARPRAQAVADPRGAAHGAAHAGAGDRADALDRASISRRAREALAAERSGGAGPGGKELDEQERQQVRELKERDREVRAHERAHQAAAGELAAAGPRFTYRVGPDGRRYAVAGEVRIHLREGGTPHETLRLARQAQRAALAPSEPSPQDRAVAARAARMALEAQREIAEQAQREREGGGAAHRADFLA